MRPETEVTNVNDDVDVDEQPTPLTELGAGRIWGMLEAAPDGMLMADAGGVILAVNQQLEHLFGYDRADLLGLKVEVLLPERLREVHRAHRTRYRAEPTIRSMGANLQLRARRSDGSEFPVEVSLSPLVDDEGLAIVASVRDISERLRVSAHNRRVQAAIDAVHDGVYMFEPRTLRFVYANEGASAQTGYSNDELLSMTPLHIKPEFTRERFEAFVRPLIAGEVEHVSFRTVHRGKSGADMPVDIVLEYRGRDADGPGDGEALLVAIARDVTEQVAVERKLSLSEETFRTTFENAPVGMTISHVSDDGRRSYERVNTTFARMLGRSVESLVGTDFVEISHPDDREQLLEAMAEIAAGRRSVFMAEKRCLRADGRGVWTLVHATVIDRSDGVRTLTHVIDITDRRERQAERERMTTMEDRERIARDLHDIVIQRLFGAGMKLQAAIPEMGSDTAVARTHETIDELDMTIRELRSTIFSLQQRETSRSVTDEITLAVDQSVDRLGFRPAMVVDGALDSVSVTSSDQLQATVREALSNVARHAQASAVEVRIDVMNSALTLTVTDDGRGFDITGPRGNGLNNMDERARRLGGEFSVRSGDTGGTTLTWSVPS